MWTPFSDRRDLVVRVDVEQQLAVAEAAVAVTQPSAKAARTSPTTITRIESGEADPTFGTLSRLLDAAGFMLETSLRPHPRSVQLRVQIADLTRAWARHGGNDEPDWTAFRAALDLLRQHPQDISAAIRRKPRPSGSAAVDALVAGITDKLADHAGLPRPAWTAKVAGLAQEWSLPGTMRMLEQWRRTTPPQLQARNLVVARETLWRPLPAAAQTAPAA